MKKILVASTALVAAGLLTTGTASASEKIKLNLGGFSKWWVVGAWNDDSFAQAPAGGNGSDYATVDVKGDNEVFFGGSTTLDNGIKVGVDVQLEAGGHTETTGGVSTNGDVIDESYVWIEGGFGKFIVGSENNGAYLLHVSAPDAAGNWGEGGIAQAGWAIAKPSDVQVLGGGSTTAINTDGDSEKITYVAPTFYGLTVGATYVPTAGTGMEDTAFPATAAEIYGVGALYANTFGSVGVKLSGGYVTYDIAGATDRSQEWSLGGQLSYAGFTIGGSYRDVQQNEGNAPTAGGAGLATSTTGYGWDAGIQYASGPYAVSLAYFTSQVAGSTTVAGDDKVEIYQVSGKYNLGAGVDVLASIAHVEFDDENQQASTGFDSRHNEGWTVMTGLSLAF